MVAEQVMIQSGHVATEGDTLYYEARGQGQPLVLIPGAGGDADRYTPSLTADVLMKQGLLPVTNYLPDVEAIKKNGVRMFMAAGKPSLDKKRWYAETAQILAGKLGCEMVIFPGHHASFMGMTEEWSATLRNVLHKAGGVSQ
jgi:hypothetical protein